MGGGQRLGCKIINYFLKSHALVFLVFHRANTVKIYVYLGNAQKFKTMGESKEVKQESKILNYTWIVEDILITSTALEIKAVSQSYHKIYCQVIRRRLFSRKCWGRWSLLWKKKQKTKTYSWKQVSERARAESYSFTHFHYDNYGSKFFSSD